MATPYNQTPQMPRTPVASAGSSAPPGGHADALVDQLYCDGCERAVPGAGCRRWGRYTLCLGCQQEYFAAWAAGRRMSPGQYVRDKRFGESETYRLPD